jgi:3-isopropylmalate dehydratase small subunit
LRRVRPRAPAIRHRAAGRGNHCRSSRKDVTGPHEQSDRFEIPDFSRECLLNGYDEIELTFLRKDMIQAYEKSKAAARPWL